MAVKKYYVGLDLQKNQLQNALMHPLSTAPSSPTEGQVYWNTVDKKLYIWNGTEWSTSTHQPVSVAAGSTDYISIDGNQEISVKALAITNVTVDNTETSLANFVTTNYSAGTEFQEGDVVILNAVTNKAEKRWIHNGGTAGTTDDFTKLDDVLTASEVRSYISGSSGITYDSGSGAISADVDDTTIQVGVSGLEVKDSSITQTKLDSNLESKIVTGYAETVGDGTATSFTITHNLGTQDIMTAMYEVSTGECVQCQVTRDSNNQITVGVFPAPTTNNLRILVQKMILA